MTQTLKDKTILITGASRGVGYEVAKACAAKGAHIIAVARTSGALEALDDEVTKLGGSATLVPLDLNEMDKIDALGASIFERWGKLDAFIANAGMLGPLMPVGHLPPDQFEKVQRLNVTANYRLIRSLDPLLHKAENAHALFVTSGITNHDSPYWGAYATSKAALEALVGCYAQEQTESNLAIHLVDPGRVATKMRAQAFPGENPETLPSPADIAPAFVKLLEANKGDHALKVHVKDFI